MGKNNLSRWDNQSIANAIQSIARHGIVNSETGAVIGTNRVSGYVVKINTDGEWAGTVDVKDYNLQALSDDEDMELNYHPHCLLSALQDGRKGMVIIPKIGSDVVLSKDEDTGMEYVTMVSHVDVIQLDSHEQITLGVKEREAFELNDENGKEVDELDETGVFTKTEYKKDSIQTDVQAKKDDKDSHVSLLLDGTQSALVVGDNKTKVTSDLKGHHVEHDKSKVEVGDKEVRLEHDKSKITMQSSDIVIENGGSKVKVKDGTVFVGSDSGTDDAVLGGALCDVLMDLCGYLAQVKTTTQLGPQPFLNMAQFIALKSKIQAAKGAHNKFLTKKVQIQK